MFKARAGVNDTANSPGSVRAVAIVSDDVGNVLAGYVNGQLVDVTLNSGVWSFSGAIPPELTATNDLFADFDVPLGSDAAFLTLAITGGSSGISSDHGVFSGARLTFTQVVPEPATFVLTALCLSGLGSYLRRRRG